MKTLKEACEQIGTLAADRYFAGFDGDCLCHSSVRMAAFIFQVPVGAVYMSAETFYKKEIARGSK